MPLAQRRDIGRWIANFVIIGCSERKGCDLCLINEPLSWEKWIILSQIVIIIAKKRHMIKDMIKNIIVKVISKFDSGCGMSSNLRALPNYSDNHKWSHHTGCGLGRIEPKPSNNRIRHYSPESSLLQGLTKAQSIKHQKDHKPASFN